MTTNFVRTMKRHDTGEPVRIKIISDNTGDPVDLSGAAARFMLYQTDDDGLQVELVNELATIELPATEGVLRYDWATGDTDITGQHRGSFEVVFAAGNKETYPRKGYLEINIEPDLEDN